MVDLRPILDDFRLILVGLMSILVYFKKKRSRFQLSTVRFNQVICLYQVNFG